MREGFMKVFLYRPIVDPFTDTCEGENCACSTVYYIAAVYVFSFGEIVKHELMMVL